MSSQVSSSLSHKGHLRANLASTEDPNTTLRRSDAVTPR